ncbi:M81 family metallopeptidase [Nitrospirillum sp. BR 11164]|uniref:M81 family metallopeptidase n=1 Tax=Nitrospirillum sp. BR 11164 TaxID=3104324 RepID=UPI002AFE8B7C|nr:M81 family metallopeptidase [Nitrospirillum sp. BR 11164]MEA1652771.1 M81 family metallopeptidase [Nitrospirillum sp. BR 11164]
MRTGPLTVFVAGLVHETNSFSPLPTSMRSFTNDLRHLGGDPATLARARVLPAYGDLFTVAERHGDRVIDGPTAGAQPSGPAPRGVYEALRDALLADLKAAMVAQRVDMVVLTLHGAMVAQDYPDCEGDLLTHVRALVGPDMPVGVTLDLHGNATQAMVDSGAVIIACKEYPHVDFLARMEELYAILASIARGGPKARTHIRKVPVMGLFGTTEQPMRGFVDRLADYEGRDGVLSVSMMHGFIWSDTEHTGAAVLAVSDGGDPAAVDRVLAAIAADFQAIVTAAPLQQRLPLGQAVDKAVSLMGSGKPVVLADSSDNPGGGAACDSTFVLRALLDRGVQDVALGMIWDPQAALIAADAGVGAQLPLRIGGKIGPLSGDPVDLDVTVTAVRDDIRQRGLATDGDDPIGLAVALRVGTWDIVLNSTRQQTFSPGCFTELGIDLSAKALVVVKSTQHFRATFDAISAATVYCDAPGSLNMNLGALPYRHLRRPIWPLDPVS